MSSSTVEIAYDGVDITNSVIYSSARFTSQQNARPGTFEITLRDRERTLGPFVTGKELTAELDGIRLFGGYVTQISQKFAFPADKLPSKNRLWVLRGVDYNILFDKRVTRNPANYLRSLPVFTADTFDGDLIKDFCANYLDLPVDLDFETHVDNIRYPFAIASPDADRVGSWKQQGSTWREQMELIAQWSGAVWYIDANKNLHFHAIEDSLAPFGFSDSPDGVDTIGFRDGEGTEDGGLMVNDALVWGGSEWTEGAVFARAQNATSISDHNRWQHPEHHFGEDSYKLDTQWRADLIVEGSDAVVGFNPGLAYPQWDITLSWFGHRIPAGKDHIQPGQLVEVDLTTMGGALSPITLPMRSISISFPTLDSQGKGYPLFTGSLGLRLDDPFTIWDYLLRTRRLRTGAVAAATNTTTTTTYGAYGQFEPTHLGSNVYDLPNDLGYIANTTQVYVGGVLQSRGTDYTESDPIAGEITFSSAPADWVWIVCRTT